MSFISNTLNGARPSSINAVNLPRRENYYASPADWRDEILYFLLPDRFSDGQESSRVLYNRRAPANFRPMGFQWNLWRTSGGDRFQGGTIRGLTSKLDYIKGLGVTTVWVGPVFKQRRHLDTYHGYAIQDFLEVDERFGTRNDLVELVETAHSKKLRVILDIIFNHSGHNWDYQNGQVDPPYLPWPEYHQFGSWIGASGGTQYGTLQNDDGVWPSELQTQESYTRAGLGSLSDDDIRNPRAESKRSDFPGSFRDFNFDGSTALTDLAKCYKYWIALTDCDGFRLDTLKHVAEEHAAAFCNTIKEFAANLGKVNFLLVGEVAGPDCNAGRYLEAIGLNLSATLDIGELRTILHDVAKGIREPAAYFNVVKDWTPVLGSHRNSGPRHVTILDDHDHVYGAKVRFSMDAPVEHQVVAGVAIQLFSLGVPCIYYGTEQAFAGPEKAERERWLPDLGTGLDTSGKKDRYLRETMFGADHPRLSGLAGLAVGGIDPGLPGFGAFGSVGAHFFDPGFHVYRRLAALIAIRAKYPVLRYGRLYLREVSNFGLPFAFPPGGELIAWSRILDDEEGLCIVNGNATAARGGDVVVDLPLNSKIGSAFRVIENSAQTIAGAAYQGTHPVGELVPVQYRNGALYVSIRDLGSAEVLLLNNRP